jgi:hypothetical protein
MTTHTDLKLLSKSISKSLSLILILAAFLLFSTPSSFAAAGQKTFASPQEAAKAFADACEKQDTATLVSLLGPGGEELINSGDEQQDTRRRERFATLAKESTEVRPDPYYPERFLVYVGKRNWPLPIPIVKKGDAYGFDPAVARTEILARRVGHNELDAIEFLHGFVRLEIEYAYSDSNHNGMRDYAQSLVSTPGQQDGLYWEAQEGQPASPAADFVADILSYGYELPAPGESMLFHGYVFKILKAQGSHAAGGARDYVVTDVMIGGFAMIAYPAEYAASGVKTFIVNLDDVVWEKDLGAKTTALASATKAYDPGSGWVESPREEPEKPADTKP